MKLKNKFVSIYNRKTSMRLANEEWSALDAICKRENIKRKRLLELIEDNKDKDCGLTSFVRLFVMVYMQKLALFSGLKSKPQNPLNDIYQTFEAIS